jgi:hypothetical protein
MTDDAEAARDILQHFGHIFAELAHRAAAVRTAVNIRGCVHNLIARRWSGSGARRGLRGAALAGNLRAHALDHTLCVGMFGLEILQRQLKLIGLMRKTLDD